MTAFASFACSSCPLEQFICRIGPLVRNKNYANYNLANRLMKLLSDQEERERRVHAGLESI